MKTAKSIKNASAAKENNLLNPSPRNYNSTKP